MLEETLSKDMKIDLHIHSRECSDGKMGLPQIFREARKRGIGMLSIADHDNVDCQGSAAMLATKYDMIYISGVELSISFSHPKYRGSKPVSLDVLGYQYDTRDRNLLEKLKELRERRRIRAEQIVEKLNHELSRNGVKLFTQKDFDTLKKSVGGALGRPHIADYLTKIGIVSSRQKAFDKYLVKCNVPKMPLSLQEASELIRGAGGKLILAHPNDPNGTSLNAFTPSLSAQQQIIKDAMRPYLDGLECWHPRHTEKTASTYLAFAQNEGMMATGGSDCHQQPIKMGTVNVPSFVADQFGSGEKWG